MRTSELDYELPERLIARTPPQERDGGRLLVVDRGKGGARTESTVRELPRWLPADALLVLNDTRVIRARLFGTKPSGGRTEVFLLKPRNDGAREWHALARASNRVRAGTRLSVGPRSRCEHPRAPMPTGPSRMTLECDAPWEAIERHGEMPLPPYMGRRPSADDGVRYQTRVREERWCRRGAHGRTALQTALLGELADRGIERADVTLHVGAGTVFARGDRRSRRSSGCMPSTTRSRARLPMQVEART